MYDIKPLEEDWKKYKFKKKKLFYLVVFMIVCILVIAYYFFNNIKYETRYFYKLYQHISSFSENNSEKNSTISKHSFLVNDSLNKSEVLDITNAVADEQRNISADKLLVDIPILDKNDANSLSNTEITKKGKGDLNIFETTSTAAYEYVERRFKESGDVDDALFLARSYYEKGNFKKSKYWAFETNKLDSSIEESFLIFVKSKSKLGKTNEAISILNAYLKQINSIDAKILLEKLTNNKL